MIIESELLELLEKENLYAFKSISDIGLDKMIILDSIDDVIKFAKLNNIYSVFYEYLHYFEEEYKFDLEDLELSVDESIFKAIKKDLINYNNKTNNIDFSKPNTVIIYTLYQGKTIGLFIVDNWLDECDDIVNAEIQLDLILEKYQEIVLEKELKEREKLENLKLEFEELLLNDEEFLNCTNQNMRDYYMKSVFDKPNMRKYKSIFITTDRFRGKSLDNKALCAFTDMVWKKYKGLKR